MLGGQDDLGGVDISDVGCSSCSTTGQVNRVRPSDATEMRCWGIADCRYDVLLGKGGNEIGRLADGVGGTGEGKEGRVKSKRWVVRNDNGVTTKAGERN